MWLLKLWYQKHLNPVLWILVPFSLIMVCIVKLRRFAYLKGWLTQTKFDVPIIVVGNLTVGGTGKTPLVIHIAKLLKQHGFKTGIVSRGYKGDVKLRSESNIFVNANSDPAIVGDEPVLLAKRLFCPIVVDKDRVKAVQTLLSTNSMDVIISDDGLQHYRMGRSIEIVVVDGKRRFGNGWCLPAGPLREPLSRLESVNYIMCNGPENFDVDSEYDMELRPRMLYNGHSPSEQRTLASFQGSTIHAVAGIGNPDRFFALLKNYGLQVIPHPFPDHYMFKPSDLEFSDSEDYPIVMTEKDAVKCGSFMKGNTWVLAVDAVVNPLFDAKLLSIVQELCRGQKTA